MAAKEVAQQASFHNMPSIKWHCLGCSKQVALRTIRRHLKHGCDRQRRRHTKLCEAADAIIERAGRECRVRLDPIQPFVRPSRHYHRRNPPTSPPPDVLRDLLAHPPRDPPPDFPMRSPEIEHPDFQYDTSGAGPGPASQDASPRFARRPPRPPPTDEDDENTQYTLRDAFPWIEDLTGEEYLVNQFLSKLVRTGDHKLAPHQKFLVQTFNYKVSTDITGIAYSKLRRAFPDRLGDLPSAARLRTRIGVIAGLRGHEVDCCVNSCIAYTGPYKNEEYCPHCPEPRYRPNAHPSGPRVARKVFQYIPLIPRLLALYRNLAMARKLRYRSERPTAPHLITNIFDGAFYRQLLDRRVTVGAKTLGHNYFSKPTDLALGLSTDGFGPFKSRKQTCWPLTLFNYNLHPSIRTQLEHIMCIGVIPGPKPPKELTTYLEPLIAELEDLAYGIPAFDTVDGETFALRAYLITAFGDMPAVAKLMAMKGPGARYPCRACSIRGVARGGKDPGSNKPYTPLSRPFLQAHNAIRNYDPFNLPRRSHVEHVRQAIRVEAARNDAEEQRRSLATGISGLSPLIRLSSLEFPTSFPHDFMHIMFQNLLPMLLQLWTKTDRFKDFGADNEDYHLHKDVYSAIGAACADNGKNIPSAFGCRVPDIQDKPHELTAESMLLFATLLGPALLRHRFRRPRYYRHFIQLVKLINLCIGLEITREQVQEVREGFAKWVQQFESYYYREDRTRLWACTLPLHALLHIADDIEAMGPVWCYWAFPMERFCGAIGRANKSRRYPYSSINRHVLQLSQLSLIKNSYGLTEELDLGERRANIASGKHYGGYSDLVFVAPERLRRIQEPLIPKVARFISKKIGVDKSIVQESLRGHEFTAWGKMQRIVQSDLGDLTGGDTIRGNHIVSDNRETRDATHVKYWSKKSHWRWDRGPAINVDEEIVSYGRAEQFIVIDANFLRDLTDTVDAYFPHLDPLVLAVVSPIPYLQYVPEADIVQYRLRAGSYVSPEIVDASKIDSLVGRVITPLGTSYIVERDSVVGQLDMLDVVVNPD